MSPSESVLVDTHALLWWKAGSKRLSAAAAALINRADTVLVSPISCWEVAMLVAKERVALDRPVDVWTNDLFATGESSRAADLSPAIAVSAAQLPEFHGDPADRLIYATAKSVGVPLVTKDERLQEYAALSGDVTTAW
jgi:PIN domain nuclease of toxin-antitoxin system